MRHPTKFTYPNKKVDHEENVEGKIDLLSGAVCPFLARLDRLAETQFTYMHTDVLQYVQSRLNAVIQAFDMSAPAHVAMELGNQVQRKTPDWKMTDQTAGPEKNHRSGRKAGEARRLFAWSCGFASPAMHPSFPDRLFSSRLVRLFLKTISHPHNIYIALKNN